MLLMDFNLVFARYTLEAKLHGVRREGERNEALLASVWRSPAKWLGYGGTRSLNRENWTVFPEDLYHMTRSYNFLNSVRSG
jgi:hypothetical protein